VLADRNAAPRATALAAHLAGALGNRALVPLVQARLDADADPATTASAADALARLDPTGLACKLTALLGRTDLDLMAVVPTTVLGLAAAPGSVGSEARGCLTSTIGTAGPGRETAIWIGAALGDAALVPAFQEALAADPPAVRRAAAWALGEMPSDAATGALLVRARDGDLDATVRRFAAGAIAKQEGRVPRAALATPPLERGAG
jgi:HEAT repeat protein